MQYIQGISRHQLQITSLEDKITPDNLVRFLDAFVECVDLQKVGFMPVILKSEGRPSFQNQVFLNIYLVRLLGILAIAKTQIPVRINFMGKGICTISEGNHSKNQLKINFKKRGVKCLLKSS